MVVFHFVTINPLITPINAPIKMPTTIVKIGLNPLDDNIAHATSTTAMVDPTERSIPAVIIAIVIPIARNAFTVPCCIIQSSYHIPYIWHLIKKI